MKRQTGFTILELLMTLTIVGVAASIAAPSFTDMIKSNRIATQANSIISALHYARQETINQAVSVRIEPVSGATWNQGWQIRSDSNNDGDFDDADDELIRVYEPLTSSSLANDQGSFVIFNASGESVDGNGDPLPVQLTLKAYQCTGEHQRNITISVSGLIYLDDNKTCI